MLSWDLWSPHLVDYLIKQMWLLICAPKFKSFIESTKTDTPLKVCDQSLLGLSQFYLIFKILIQNFGIQN